MGIEVVHHGLDLFNPSAIVFLSPCRPAILHVCVFDIPFEPSHARCLLPSDPWCLFAERDTGLKLAQPFVCPHKTSLPARQSTGLGLSLKL